MAFSLLAGIALAGTLAAGAGTYISYQGQKDAASAQQQQIAFEQQAEAKRQQAMELDARRRQLEILRNQQRARSLATATAFNQGAGFGSGVQGGFGQIGGETETNLLGLSQNLQIGRDMFGINAGISQSKIDQSQALSFSSIGTGLQGFGVNLLNSSQALNRLFTPSTPYYTSPYNPARPGAFY